MEPALAVVERLSNVMYILLALAALRSWWRHRDGASAWLATTFASLGAIVAVGVIAGDDPEPVVTLLTVAVLAAFPYFLLRFSGAFDAVARPLHVAAVVATILVIGGAVAVTTSGGFPGPDEPTTRIADLYTLSFVVQWFGILGVVAIRLWRAGHGQPAIARRRMRLMSLAAIVIVLALALTAAGSADSAVLLTGQVFGVLAAALFYLGFATPRFLRAAWRSEAEDELYSASVALMRARTPDEVGQVLVPHLGRVIGARGVALRSAEGLDATFGELDGEATRSHELLRASIEIWGSPYAPFFGDEEDRLLGRLGLLTDLALDRTALLQAEQRARREVEATNAELEAFVYSASHDLKTPLIAFLGYLDLLEMDEGVELSGETPMFIHRMRSNGLHMQALIDDLLALSRVGRVDTEPERVDLEDLFTALATDLRQTHPDARLEVDGVIPEVWLNPTRAQQLVSNVVGNAFKHAGRPDVIVRVSATAAEKGKVEIRVLDNGVGIPDEHLDRVTRVFERLEAGHGSGTGIGLAVAKKICLDADGDLRFEPCDAGADLRLLLVPSPSRSTGGASRAPRPGRPRPLDRQGV